MRLQLVVCLLLCGMASMMNAQSFQQGASAKHVMCLLSFSEMEQSSDAVELGSVLRLADEADKGFWLSEKIALPFPEKDQQISLGMSAEWASQNAQVGSLKMQYRSSENGYQWGEWQDLAEDIHGAADFGQSNSHLVFLQAQSNYVQIKIELYKKAAAPGLSHLTLNFLYPQYAMEQFALRGDDDYPEETAVVGSLDELATAMPRPSYTYPQPQFRARKQWDPWKSHPFPVDSLRDTTDVSHIIIHHSAVEYIGPSWDYAVRTMWDYHVLVRKWNDIGYNYLIAPDGTIYEGRGEDIMGSHFNCSNRNTMGICLLGSYEYQKPTTATWESLVRLIAWQAGKSQIHPLKRSRHDIGLVLPNIAGHRDGNQAREGCPHSTVCPGWTLYKMLPDLRTEVAHEMMLWREHCNPLTEDEKAALLPPPMSFSIDDRMGWYQDYVDVKRLGDAFSVIYQAGEHEFARLQIWDMYGRKCWDEWMEKPEASAVCRLKLDLPKGMYRFVWQVGDEVEVMEGE